jgi:acetyl-CoA carboxylase biotin carboxyl carrier protein
MSQVDLKRVEELIDLMREAGLSHLSLELPEFKVSITRGQEGTKVEGGGAEPHPQTERPAGETPTGAEPPVRQESAGLPVVSPVVGVFHNGGMLDPRELVAEGDRVQEGQLLAAIEAMKVPNELRAPVSGLVRRLLVEDGSAVEYGQTLFVIEPERGGGVGDGDIPIGIL